MNNKVRTIIFSISGLLLLAGAALYLSKWSIAPYLFAVGSAGIAICYLTLSVKNEDFRRRRLHRLNLFASFLMIGASAFMFKHKTEWIACLLIAAILQLYTAFVTPSNKNK